MVSYPLLASGAIAPAPLLLAAWSVTSLPVSTTFTYAAADFSRIPDSARATLIELTTRLLDTATRYLNGAPDEGPLFQAEQDFHETLVAKHPRPAPRRVSQFAEKPGTVKPKRRVPTKEEMDAEIDAFLVESRARIREAQEHTRRKLDAWRSGKGV